MANCLARRLPDLGLSGQRRRMAAGREREGMAYFDSSKNRALWEIRLGQLRKERELRLQGDAGDAFKEEADRQMSAGTRIRMTYQELLQEEAMASEKNRKERGAREMGRDRTRVRAPEREGMGNEMG